MNKKSGQLVTTSLPLQPRDGLVLQPVSVASQLNSENGAKVVGNGGNLNQLITLHNDSSSLTAQVCNFKCKENKTAPALNIIDYIPIQ